jgi:hypothetical protein
MNINVSTSDALKSALLSAKPGDTIVLQAGETFTGEFILPAKSDPLPITLRSSATLPDRRLTPADAPLLPLVRSGVVAPAVVIERTRGWTLDGIQVESTSNGEGEAVVIQDAEDAWLGRILMVAGPNGQKRGIRGNGRNVKLWWSHIANIFGRGQDSQAFCAWDGAGPYNVFDNYLEAASENIMFGGANSAIAGNIPSDILVEGNDCVKRPEWQTEGSVGKAIKNLFELKSARRVTVRNNRFRGNWTDAQSGAGILITVRNDEGQSPWSCVEDVLFEDNVVTDTERGINILGWDMYQPSGRTTRITIRNNNVQTTAGYFLQAGGEVGELTVEDNQTNAHVFLYGGEMWPAGGVKREALYAVEKLILNRNGETFIGGDSVGNGATALKRYTKTSVWNGVTIIGETPPPVEPPVEPPPADIVGPDVRIAVLSRSGKSGNWAFRADTEATDVSIVSVVVRRMPSSAMVMQKQLFDAPYTATLALKGIHGTVTVSATAIDKAGNVGTASRTLVLA